MQPRSTLWEEPVLLLSLSQTGIAGVVFSTAKAALLVERCERNDYCVLYDHRSCFPKGIWIGTKVLRAGILFHALLQLWSTSLSKVSPPNGAAVQMLPCECRFWRLEGSHVLEGDGGCR